jgi:hypothetical protein
MTHPSETLAARALSAVRALPRPFRAEPGKPIVPDLYAAWDARSAKVSFELVDDPGALLALRVEVEGAPRWLSLNLVLGTEAFAPGDVLGLALAARADSPLTLAPYVRSRLGEVTRDTTIDDAIEVGTGFRPVVRLLGLAEGDGLTDVAQFHTLILPLPQQSFTLVIRDLRVFVQAVGAAALPSLPDLGSFAL